VAGAGGSRRWPGREVSGILFIQSFLQVRSYTGGLAAALSTVTLRALFVYLWLIVREIIGYINIFVDI
jgi:hypothetical protein